MRRAGSAALDLAFVAAGRVDVFWEIGLSRWDMAAGSLLVTEAGGLVGDLEGNEGWMESGNTGAVYVFRREYDGWHESQKITGDKTENDSFGINVKLDANGRTLVVGHGRAGGGTGSAGIDVQVHERNASAEGWLHGYRININPDGARALHECLPPGLWQAFVATSALLIALVHLLLPVRKKS